jgi:hypothetical protein
MPLSSSYSESYAYSIKDAGDTSEGCVQPFNPVVDSGGSCKVLNCTYLVDGTTQETTVGPVQLSGSVCYVYVSRDKDTGVVTVHTSSIKADGYDAVPPAEGVSARKRLLYKFIKKSNAVNSYWVMAIDYRGMDDLGTSAATPNTDTPSINIFQDSIETREVPTIADVSKTETVLQLANFHIGGEESVVTAESTDWENEFTGWNSERLLVRKTSIIDGAENIDLKYMLHNPVPAGDITHLSLEWNNPKQGWVKGKRPIPDGYEEETVNIVTDTGIFTRTILVKHEDKADVDVFAAADNRRLLQVNSTGTLQLDRGYLVEE